MNPLHLTGKQLEIMKVVLAGNGTDGDANLIPVDLDELLERLGYQTTKASIQFSLRALIARGLMEKGEPENRRGRQRAIIKPTEKGAEAYRWSTRPPEPARIPMPKHIDLGSPAAPASPEILPELGSIIEDLESISGAEEGTKTQ
jgi:hypothetical protein